MATHVEIRAALEALDISGVRILDSPPTSVNGGDLPVAFLGLPNTERGELLTSCTESSKRRTAQMIVLLYPAAQSTLKANYRGLFDTLDALEATLDGWTLTNFIEYEISPLPQYPVAEVEYWALEVSITLEDFR